MNRLRENQRTITWRMAPFLLGGMLVALPLIAFGADRKAPSLNSSLETLGFVKLTGNLAAPDFTLLNLSGTPVRLADLHGKIVFLTFWTTW